MGASANEVVAKLCYVLGKKAAVHVLDADANAVEQTQIKTVTLNPKISSA